ncbi:MAG TPA: RHS repeat-associated core domain-containing protein [Candidatus Bathyarchaeia archaeon]|nr:RHS repeat-associated core domain-containing protein [Candidatus Bathyarchaeia archaeon]
MVTDQNRNIVFSDNYQPYGQDNSATGSETYKFTGKPVSATTGLYYYYHRWYDSSMGRSTSPD